MFLDILYILIAHDLTFASIRNTYYYRISLSVSLFRRQLADVPGLSGLLSSGVPRGYVEGVAEGIVATEQSLSAVPAWLDAVGQDQIFFLIVTKDIVL